MNDCLNCQTHSSASLPDYAVKPPFLNTLTCIILDLVFGALWWQAMFRLLLPALCVRPSSISCSFSYQLHKVLLSGLCRRGMLATPRIVAAGIYLFESIYFIIFSSFSPRLLCTFVVLLLVSPLCSTTSVSLHTLPLPLVSFRVGNIMAPLRVEKIHGCHQQTWLFPEHHSLQLPVLSLFFLLWSLSLKTHFL